MDLKSGATDGYCGHWHEGQERVVPVHCEWKQDDDWDSSENWETSCGQAFVLTDEGPPSKHGFKFCCFCGRSLTEVPYVQEDDEDEEVKP
jgi:hypothetical protein